MSADALAWAFRQRGAPGVCEGAHNLLLWLADDADKFGVCGVHHPRSRRSLAGALRMSVDTIDRWLRQLEGAGLLHKEQRFAGATALTSVFHLQLHPQKGVAADLQRGVAAPGAATRVFINLHPKEEILSPLSSAASVSAAADQGVIKTWAARLYAVAGPGLGDPAKHAQLHFSEREFVLWASAGVDLELDAAPTVRARTSRLRRRPLLSWAVLRDDVLAAAAYRRQTLTLPETPYADPEAARRTTCDGKPASRWPDASERERARTGARRNAWVQALDEHGSKRRPADAASAGGPFTLADQRDDGARGARAGASEPEARAAGAYRAGS